MSADVIIVGAGVAGAATAFHLSRLGAGDVLVVDRDTAGSGMSSRSSAMIRMHYTFRPEVELAVRSDRMFDAWTELTGRPAFVRRTGFARIVLPGEEGALRANVAMHRDCGARTEIVLAMARRARAGDPHGRPDRGGRGALRRIRGRRAGRRGPAGRGPGAGGALPPAYAGPGAAAQEGPGDRDPDPGRPGTRRDRGGRGRGVVSGPVGQHRRRPADRDGVPRGRGAQPRTRPGRPGGLHRLDHPELLPARGGRQQDAGGQLHRLPRHRSRHRGPLARRGPCSSGCVLPRRRRTSHPHDGPRGWGPGITKLCTTWTPDGGRCSASGPGCPGWCWPPVSPVFQDLPAVGEAVAALVTGRAVAGAWTSGVPAGPVRRGAGRPPFPYDD
jgi:hypothetical protein